MNILGYIIAVLILVAIAFQTYYSNWFYDQKIRQSYQGHNQAVRSIHKEYIKRNFDKIPEKKEPSKKNTNEEVQGERIFKKKELTPSCMRLNLQPLLKEEKRSEHFLYKTLVKLIEELYLPDIIDTKDLIPFIEEFLSEVAKKVEFESLVYLEQIQFSGPAYQRMYYRMLSSKNSLLNYIKITPNERICLSCSDDILLKCLFNEEIKNRLIRKKKAPLERMNISKEELEKWILVFGQDPFSLSFMQCKHSNKEKEMTITVKDGSTDIVLKQTLPFFSNSSENDG